jgi:hypothetical protein
MHALPVIQEEEENPRPERNQHHRHAEDNSTEAEEAGTATIPAAHDDE